MSETHGEIEVTGGQAVEATDLVRRFLYQLQDGDVDGAVQLLSSDARYTNVSLPAIQGRERIRKALGRAMRAPRAGFEVYIHRLAASGSTVLTERTDVLIVGPVRVQIWVCGRFDVKGGEIVLWKDYFDWWNLTVATVRGLLGAVVPTLAPSPPPSAPIDLASKAGTP